MKIKLFLIFLFAFTLALAQENSGNTQDISHTVTQSGIGLGSVIAVVASWDRNRSILWAILHGILGWLYVIYFALTDNK